MDFFTPATWDALIWAVIIIGLALAAVRLYQDLRRPIPQDRPEWADEDTQPHLSRSQTGAQEE